MKPRAFLLLFLLSGTLLSCVQDEDSDADMDAKEANQPSSEDYKNVLANQVDEVIIASCQTYAAELTDLVMAKDSFKAQLNAVKLTELRAEYQAAYRAYQAVAVHDFYATANANLVNTTNLYPIDTAVLNNLISNRSYNFNTSANQRANGFPAIDYMLYGPADVVAYLNADPNRIDFLDALINDMKAKADNLYNSWSGSLRNNFIENGGTALGSSISVQLNQSLLYYEKHIRENKVGIPIGRLGPNDSPIAADPSKIEAYYQAQAEGNEDFTLALLKASIEEMEDWYLGENAQGSNGMGYDDLLNIRGHASADADIKAAFQDIYQQIDNRNSISGDERLYNSLQKLVTLYKSDLFPLLNVQDADGLNDGD
ncbi:MAG: imelysin family protein [Vicingaceae bacterium]